MNKQNGHKADKQNYLLQGKGSRIALSTGDTRGDAATVFFLLLLLLACRRAALQSRAPQGGGGGLASRSRRSWPAATVATVESAPAGRIRRAGWAGEWWRRCAVLGGGDRPAAETPPIRAILARWWATRERAGGSGAGSGKRRRRCGRRAEVVGERSAR